MSLPDVANQQMLFHAFSTDTTVLSNTQKEVIVVITVQSNIDTIIEQPYTLL